MTTAEGTIKVDKGIVTAEPAAFARAIKMVKDDGLRGVTITTDWRDEDPDAPTCDLSLLAEVAPSMEHFAIVDGIPTRRTLHLESIYALRDLKALSLHQYPALDLARFPQLEVLFLTERRGLRGIETLTALRELRITGLGSPDVSGWKELRALAKLWIIQADRKITTLAGLEVLTGLRHVEIHHCPKLAGVRGLPEALLQFKVMRCPAFTDFAFLAGNPSLDFLYATTLESLAFLPTMEAITRLGCERVVDGDLSPVLATKTMRFVACTDKKHHSHKSAALMKVLEARP